MNALRFYTTAGCSLCDEALAAVQPVAKRRQLPLEIIDIMQDSALEERFGTRIPVVERHPDGELLGWPFTTAQLYRFVL